MAVRKVKVWNDHTRPYSEQFRDAMLTIPAKSFIVMEEPEAALFMGQYTPVKRDGHGNDLAPKMLRKEVIEGEYIPYEQLPECMACRERFETQDKLNEHVKLMHLPIMLDDDAKQSVVRNRKA